jgi:2-amino-4-hydroxy-6-hydroxymethyldihydropteridine diphosphokinase/dihydropteroate synthase
MDIYLGLGSNQGDRRAHLRAAIAALGRSGIECLRISPVVESPALLPSGAPPEWNRPFLNLVVHARVSSSPEAVHALTRNIESAQGRQDSARWSPRPIDIDLLLWGRETIATDSLRIPHPELHRRAFVLSPLIALEPMLTIPGLPPLTVLEWSTRLTHHIPLWMGVLNVTPDSFSDGGEYRTTDAAVGRALAFGEAGAQIIDIGGQSTRPGATPLDADHEWKRIAPVLERLLAHYGADPLRPLLSVDTFHAEVAARALASGIDMINDVSGLKTPAMLNLAGGRHDAQWVAMHELGLPADPAVVLPADQDPRVLLSDWIEQRLEAWTRQGLDLNRIIVDPGIGFGKNALQSLQLLRSAAELRRFGLRVLIGHSRKSFMRQFTENDAGTRDLVTIGASLQLCQQGVDILRVHDVSGHLAAYRGWSHLRG